MEQTIHSSMKSNIWKIKLSAFLWGLGFFMPVLTLYFLGNGVTLSAIVISQVFYSVFTFLGEVPTGIFADRFGQKYAVVLGHLLNVIPFVLMLILPNTAGLFIAYSLMGLADSFLSGSDEAILYESSPKESFKKHLSQKISNETLGLAVGTLAAGGILSLYGASSYNSILWLEIIAKFAAFVIALFLTNPKIKIQVAEKGSQAFSILKRSFHLIRENKTVWTLTVVAILTLSGEYFLYSVYQPYFQTHSVAPFFLGFVLSAGAVLNYVVTRYVYLLERWLPLEKILLMLNGVVALGYVSLAVLVSPIFLIAGFIVLKGFFNASTPIVSDYLHEQTSSDIRATVMSGISFTRSLFQTLARIGLGVLVGVLSIGNVFLIQAAYLVIGVVISYWLMVRCGCVNRIQKHYE